MRLMLTVFLQRVSGKEWLLPIIPPALLKGAESQGSGRKLHVRIGFISVCKPSLLTDDDVSNRGV
jgi:hypothetical protein